MPRGGKREGAGNKKKNPDDIKVRMVLHLDPEVSKFIKENSPTSYSQFVNNILKETAFKYKLTAKSENMIQLEDRVSVVQNLDSGNMVTIVVSSLAGGQGKTTVSMLLGLMLAKMGYPTLLVDADPQHSLTDWVGGSPDKDSPTLLECIKNIVPINDCVYPLDIDENLFIIPSDDALDNAQDYLSSSGMGVMLLRKRLEPMRSTFKFCIIDAPPQRSQISLAVIGAADLIVVPVEASIKGYGSLARTVDLIKDLQANGATSAQLIGVIPFRDRFIGNNQSTTCKESIEAMRDEVGAAFVLPSIVESERYKQAINQRKTLGELGYPDLEYPFQELLSKIMLVKGGK
jgi:chromosome partitioning protein